MIQILDAAFGDGKSKGPRPSGPPSDAADMTKGAGTLEEAIAHVNATMKF